MKRNQQFISDWGVPQLKLLRLYGGGGRINAFTIFKIRDRLIKAKGEWIIICLGNNEKIDCKYCLN